MELGRRMARPGRGHTPVVLGLKPQQEGLLQPWVLGSQTPEAGLHLAAGMGGGAFPSQAAGTHPAGSHEGGPQNTVLLGKTNGWPARHSLMDTL